MSIRRTIKTRRAMTAVAITTGLVLTVAGCGGGGGDGSKSDEGSSSSKPAKGSGDDGNKEEPQDPAADQVLAEVRGSDGVSLTVTSAERDEGGFLTISGQIKNGGGKFWIADKWRGDEHELRKNGASMAGAALVDQEGKKKYLVLRDTEGRCLCTKFDGGGVDTGQTAEWYAQFPAPPEGTSKVDFQVGAMPPASIELSEGE
ncbi:hypothetical protein AB0H77_42400 [Streptomyces sp. NPDC050844]|uniref:hypothetical protein n=1 Tax=Streptomyces sp. NPDC050844 TaxID=3155790 RepID=UPI0033F6F453